ncbi:MAG: mechanosensitive ion channel domain-containing protein [Cyclobacteriaceae bacterium]
MEIIENIKENYPDILVNAGTVAAAIFVGLVIKWILFAIIKKYAKSKDNYLASSIQKRLNAPATVFFPTLMLSFVVPQIEFSLLEKDSVKLIMEIADIAAFTYLLVKGVYVFDDMVRHTHQVDKADNFRDRKVLTQMTYIKRIMILLIVVVAVAAILMNFDNVRKIGAGIITSAGVAGIIVGFAAQKTIANLLAGLQIAFTQPLRIDDVLVVEGEWGRVEEINLTYVVLRIWDKRRLILPIQYFIDNPFQNWTRRSSDILGTVYLYLDYTVPVEELRTKLNEVVKDNPLWDGQVAGVQVTDTKETTLEVRALVSANDSGKAWDLRCQVREQLVDYLQKNYPNSLPKTRAEIGGELKGNNHDRPEWLPHPDNEPTRLPPAKS